VNAYDGERADGTTADLADLIRAIAKLDGIARIRFTTSHPREFTDSLIDAYATVPKLANHLHLPVQSGSDRVLALMGRGYTSLEYKSRIRKLREVRPDISLSTDFIIGFPGETQRDFEATMKLIEDVGFDQSFSFLYSRLAPRRGAAGDEAALARNAAGAHQQGSARDQRSHGGAGGARARRKAIHAQGPSAGRAHRE
jgi:tRNA-2-methylthio-N6-dimethylallyladenosine synthase